jgi:hypothetical protein
MTIDTACNDLERLATLQPSAFDDWHSEYLTYISDLSDFDERPLSFAAFYVKRNGRLSNV